MEKLKNDESSSIVADEIDTLTKKISKNKIFIFLSVLVLFFVYIGVTSSEMTLSGLLTLFLCTTFALIAYGTTVVLKPGLFSLFVPAVSLIGIFFITKDIPEILLTLSFIPAGLTLGLSVKAKKSRMQSVLYSGFISAFFIAAFLIYQLYLYKGAVNYDTFYDTVMEIATTYVNRYLLTSDNLKDALTEISPIDATSDVIKSFLAAFVLILGFAQAYFSGFVMRNIISRLGLEDEYFGYDKKWELSMSKIAAAIFILSALLFITFQDIDNIGIAAAVITIMYPLGAGLAMIGVKSALTFMQKAKMMTYFIISILLFGASLAALLIFLFIFVGLLKTFFSGTKFDIFQKEK